MQSEEDFDFSYCINNTLDNFMSYLLSKMN